MRWLKRDRWKAGIALAGMLLLLVLMVWVPVSAAGAYEGASGLATPVTGTVQASPTVDPTMTALQKQQLTLQNQQLKNQTTWWWNLGTITGTIIAAVIAVIGVFATALYNFRQWRGSLQAEREKDRIARQDAQEKDRIARQDAQEKDLKDRQDERTKQAEERFQKVVEGLGSNEEQTRVGAAVVLRTFTQPGYEQFSKQVFDLAVAHLRLRHCDQNTAEPLNSLDQALIAIFEESFPLARTVIKARSELLDKNQIDILEAYRYDGSQLGFLEYLDASRVQLDCAYLPAVDLKKINMQRAHLRKAELGLADLSDAVLSKSDFSEANLNIAILDRAHLNQAILEKTNLHNAYLRDADLTGANLSYANFRGADLTRANIRPALDPSNATYYNAKLIGADFTNADLSGANLKGVEGIIDTDLEKAKSLKGVIMTGGKMYHDSSGANLSGLDLSGSDLSGVDLSKADLSGAYLKVFYIRKTQSLTRTNLRGANLRKADLRKANLGGADLSGADLSGADLSRAKLNGAYDPKISMRIIMTDLSRANLSGADLRGTNLSYADLSEATLTEAKFNVKPMQEKDAQGKPITIEPTQWPRGELDDDAMKKKKGLTCVDCIDCSSPINISAPDPNSSIQPATVAARAAFTDTWSSDAHTVVWDWGDGTTSQGTVQESTGTVGPDNHHYKSQAGIYAITLTVTGNNGASVTFAPFKYVVLYDTSANWVSGSEEYDSPERAVIGNTSATGTANFGFQVKYSNGAVVPSDKNVLLSFPAGDISFISTSCHLLKVSSSKVTFEAGGTLNGVSEYTILVSAIDRGSGNPSGFVRFQIRDSGNNIVYDTQPGAAETDDPTTPVTKGYIAVH